MVDALTLRTDEGRDKVRKSWVSWTLAVTPGSPNGETRLHYYASPTTEMSDLLGCEEGTRRTETSK